MCVKQPSRHSWVWLLSPKTPRVFEEGLGHFQKWCSFVRPWISIWSSFRAPIIILMVFPPLQLQLFSGKIDQKNDRSPENRRVVIFWFLGTFGAIFLGLLTAESPKTRKPLFRAPIIILLALFLPTTWVIDRKTAIRKIIGARKIAVW